MRKSKVISKCGLMCALGVVIMLVGAWVGIGAYAAPMISGLIITPIGMEFGKKYHITVWCSVSIISAFIVPDVEQTMMFVFFFGLYPVLYDLFGKLPKLLRIIAKLAYFNIIIVAIEAVIMLVLVPETIQLWIIIVLLVLGNLTFIMYDFIIKHADLIIERYLGKLLK